MYVLLFQDGMATDAAKNRNPRTTLRNGHRKNLMTSAEWNQLPPAIANMEYYGRLLPAELPGRDVLNAEELDIHAKQFERTGFTPTTIWHRNLSSNWKAGRGLNQTVRVPSLMVSAEHDVVLRPSMTDGMNVYASDPKKRVVADCWHHLPE